MSSWASQDAIDERLIQDAAVAAMTVEIEGIRKRCDKQARQAQLLADEVLGSDWKAWKVVERPVERRPYWLG